MAIVVAAAVVCVALQWVVSSDAVRSRVMHTLAQTFGRSVEVSSISLAVLPQPGISVRGIAVAEDARFDPAAFLTVDEVVLVPGIRGCCAKRLSRASWSCGRHT